MWRKLKTWWSDKSGESVSNGAKLLIVLGLLWIGYEIGYSRAERYYKSLLWERMSETERDEAQRIAFELSDPPESPY